MEKTANKSSFGSVLKKIFVTGDVGSVVFALIALCIAWGIATPYFFTLNNFKNLTIYASYLGIMACGLSFPLLTGCIHLSQMPMMAMCGMVMAVTYQHGFRGISLILVAVVCGGLAGLVDAFFVNTCHIVPFIATTGSQLMFRAISYMVTDGVYITVKDDMVKAIGYSSWFGLPIMFYIMAFAFVITWFIQKYTQFGRNLYSVGSSQNAAHLAGISVAKTRTFAYMVSGMMCGLAAVVYVAQSLVALNNAGTGCEMDVTASVVIGGTSMAGGRGNIINTLVGVALMTVLANGMGLLGMDSYWQMFCKGAILVLAVLIDTIRGKA